MRLKTLFFKKAACAKTTKRPCPAALRLAAAVLLCGLLAACTALSPEDPPPAGQPAQSSQADAAGHAGTSGQTDPSGQADTSGEAQEKIEFILFTPDIEAPGGLDETLRLYESYTEVPYPLCWDSRAYDRPLIFTGAMDLYLDGTRLNRDRIRAASPVAANQHCIFLQGGDSENAWNWFCLSLDGTGPNCDLNGTSGWTITEVKGSIIYFDSGCGFDSGTLQWVIDGQPVRDDTTYTPPGGEEVWLCAYCDYYHTENDPGLQLHRYDSLQDIPCYDLTLQESAGGSTLNVFLYQDGELLAKLWNGPFSPEAGIIANRYGMFIRCGAEQTWYWITFAGNSHAPFGGSYYLNGSWGWQPKEWEGYTVIFDSGCGWDCYHCQWIIDGELCGGIGVDTLFTMPDGEQRTLQWVSFTT